MTYKKAVLIDDIRRDAKLLMKSRPELSYEEATRLARENLIGNLKVTDFQFQKPTVAIDIPYYQAKSDVIRNFTESQKSFDDEVKEKLSQFIDVSRFSQEQLDEYYVAYNMGVDITSFANSIFNASQIKFLSVMLSSGKDISGYIENPNFNPEQEFINMALAEEKRKKLELKE